jgi:hypothetical protein
MLEYLRQADKDVLQQLQSVLTTDQIEKFKELQERRRRNTREGMPSPPSE